MSSLAFLLLKMITPLLAGVDAYACHNLNGFCLCELFGTAVHCLLIIVALMLGFKLYVCGFNLSTFRSQEIRRR